MITTAHVREQEAFEDLRRLTQKDRESVAELHARMVDMETYVESQNDEKTRIQTLEAALQDLETKKMLASMLSSAPALTVNQWLEKAVQAEHTAHPRRKSKGASAGQDNSSPKDIKPSSSSGSYKER